MLTLSSGLRRTRLPPAVTTSTSQRPPTALVSGRLARLAAAAAVAEIRLAAWTSGAGGASRPLATITRTPCSRSPRVMGTLPRAH